MSISDSKSTKIKLFSNNVLIRNYSRILAHVI